MATLAEHESLEKEVTHTLAEARMVLPGVQALFGFQLIAVFNEPFFRLLSAGEQRLHLLGLLLTVVSVALLMTPAAYHRQAYPHCISTGFVKLASVLLAAGMFTLMLSVCMDCYLIARITTGDTFWSLLATLTIGVIQGGLWFVLPRLRAAQRLGSARSLSRR